MLFNGLFIGFICKGMILENRSINPNLLIDCSHSNSNKDHNKQINVAKDITQQIIDGNESIIGIMLESHLNGGRQNIIPEQVDQLKYGVSITDACINWENTEAVLAEMQEKFRPVLSRRIE